ncbi:putative membrane protein [Serratia marcescens]|nr:putative membrane protein [Serratia marcescens]
MNVLFCCAILSLFCHLLCVINLAIFLFLNDVYLFFSLSFILMC